MTILFRPVFDYDERDWIPALKKEFSSYDLRIAPDIGNPEDIRYLLGWKLFEGDRNAWPNIKAVLALSAGVDRFVHHPDFPQGAKLVRMIEPGLDRSMTEYVASFVLRFHREHDEWSIRQREKNWVHDMPKLASERTVGFLGLGHLSQDCIKTLQPFGFQIRGWSRTEKNMPGIRTFHGKDQLKPFLRECEILICLLPLTAETENILNADTLSALPRGACLINPARGKELVDEDLIRSLDADHLHYAALDVFRKEPLPGDHPFWNHPRIIITPHIAAVTVPETGAQSLRRALDILEAGGVPDGWVDREKGY